MAQAIDDRFDCSFCEQTFTIRPEHVGKRIRCPKCQAPVWVFPNRTESIDGLLATTWHYRKPKIIFGHTEIGPLSSEAFVDLVRREILNSSCDVMSPDFTASEWVELAQVNLAVVQARIAQRAAEAQRQQKITDRRAAAQSANWQTLMRAIKAAISDGQVTFNERNQLLDFAAKANIPDHEVTTLLNTESRKLVEAIVEESIEDGILEPNERIRIGELANGLGVELRFTEGQSRRLALCDLAYQLANGTYVPNGENIVGLALLAREQVIASCHVEWLEVVQLKRPAGIPLGDGTYLKSVGSGMGVLTNKRVLLVGENSAAKFALSSVARVAWYADGVFFNRTSGKSVFLRPRRADLDWDRWGMLAVYTATNEPVLGIPPSSLFVPKQVAEGWVEPEVRLTVSTDLIEPRYTFRVVGDHIGDRSHWISQLATGDPINLVREPSNPFDNNAVMVVDRSRRHLGYLKRDVATWFAPILDRGQRYVSKVHRKPPSGGLVVGVFEA